MPRRLLLAGLALAASASLAGCSQAAATELIVVVDTDYAIPGQLDEIDVDVQGPDGMHHLERQPMASAAALPYTLTVVPAGAALGPIRIVASGLSAGTTVVSREARVSLSANRSMMVRLDLLRACDASTMPCAGRSDQTCGEGGACTSVDVVPQPWTGTAGRLSDAGASADGGAGDAGAVDAFVAGDASASDAGSLDAFVGADTGAPDSGAGDAGAGDAGADAGPRCATDADCPAPITGAFGPCGGFSGACGTTGTHSRTIRSFSCMAGTCVGSDATDTQSCVGPPTDGDTCAPRSCTAWTGTCSYVGTCQPLTMQTRDCTEYTCGSGLCVGATRSETQRCPTAPAGTACTNPLVHCGVWQCNAAGTCAQFSGACTGGTICCNPPMCSLPMFC